MPIITFKARLTNRDNLQVVYVVYFSNYSFRNILFLLWELVGHKLFVVIAHINLDLFIYANKLFAIYMHIKVGFFGMFFRFVGVSGGLHAALMQLHQDYGLERWFPPQYNGDSVSQCCFREGASSPGAFCAATLL